ncbi:glycosyltransferase family protein [Rubrivivax gelatinosus]|uniref:Glycosyl transferase family 2 n=1 Tax=Rubrivivax gelatinosus TaxID=28068 RepID=A0A4R2ME43_RUBGE|nr:hypothetical protein [Rubrivivax gelatinosus]TCO97182.1 hypothetical protein EV684_12322 [Rubrivivax gelatinosus]
MTAEPRAGVAAHPGVTLVRSERKLGVGVLATPYVAFCDDDSGWAPGELKRAQALLDAFPHAVPRSRCRRWRWPHAAGPSSTPTSR